MCFPILAAVGGVVSGIGAAMGASANAASLDAQAQFKERQAKIEKAAGAYKADRVQDQVDRTLGTQRAGFAANGLALDGSAAEVIADSATEGQMDINAIRWNSNLAADNLKYEAKIDRMNAKTERRAAPLAFLAPTLNGLAAYGSSFASAGTGA